MKSLPHKCRRCGQPCRDKDSLCLDCDAIDQAKDARIAKKFDPAHTLPLHFGTPVRRPREPRTHKERAKS